MTTALNSTIPTTVVLAMAWCHGEHYCHLSVDLRFKTARIRYLDEHDLSEQSFVC